MSFWKSLVASDDKAVDSIVVTGTAAMAALIGFQGWDLIAAHHDFNPINFGGAVTAIVAAIGTAKGVRDKLTPQEK